jgi:hypothetical protein
LRKIAHDTSDYLIQGLQARRDLAPIHGDIETRLVKPTHMAAEVFSALMIDTVAAEYSAPEKTCVIIEDKLYRPWFAREFGWNFF